MSTRGLKFSYIVGEFVLCFEPDPTKARVLYDAKILETEVSRDKNGARIPAYHIHFLGWNNSWDRIVPEGHILKNTDENRALMKKLADTTKRYRINRARNKRIDKILRTAFKGKLPLADFDSDLSDDNGDEDDTSEELNDTADTEDDDVDAVVGGKHRGKENHSNGDVDADSVDGSDSSSKSGKSENRKKKQNVELEIPESLKEVLEGDYIAINKENLLVKLPADPNVINILEGFVKTFCVDIICGTPGRGQTNTEGSGIPFDRNIPLCKELVDGLRICFDYTLPLILLYGAERDQYKKLLSSYKYKPGTVSSKQDILQSPLIKTPSSRLKSSQRSAPSTPATGDSSPKIPKLSPKIFKREKIEFDTSQKPEETQVTQRRLTRQAAHDSARKSQDTVDQEEIEKEGEKRLDLNVTPSKKRDMRRRKCSGSGNPSHSVPVKNEPCEGPSSNGPSGVVSRRADPPPPLLIPSVISSQPEAAPESVDSSADSVPPSGRENTIENLLTWQLLPQEEAQKSPTYPSLIYGAHHLIRLFVKLPELIISMKMDDHKLRALLVLLEHFLDYLSERREELFPEGSHTSKD